MRNKILCGVYGCYHNNRMGQCKLKAIALNKSGECSTYIDDKELTKEYQEKLDKINNKH